MKLFIRERKPMKIIYNKDLGKSNFRKSIKIKILSLIAIISSVLISCNAFAMNCDYYVDVSSGKDSNAGRAIDQA